MYIAFMYSIVAITTLTSIQEGNKFLFVYPTLESDIKYVSAKMECFEIVL